MDYPLDTEIEILMKKVESKTFCKSFDVQLDAAKALYGQSIKFDFNEKIIEQILQDEPYYPQEVKTRISMILSSQRRKYQYLFK